MMKVLTLSITAALSLGASATASFAGDAAAGEALWRNCRSCHSITNDDGDVIQRGGRTGPNLYGVPGRDVASVDDFRYSESLLAYAASGDDVEWTEALFVEYLADPTAFLRAHLGDNSVRSAMNYRLASGAADMWAYIESVSGDH